MIKFTLTSLPPSVNESKTIRDRRLVHTAKFKKWQDDAILELSLQRRKLSGPCYYRSEILIPRCQSSADLDNFPKSIHDALHKAGRTPDDRYLVDFRVKFYAGNVVVIAIKKESLGPWIKIMKPSKSLAKKLEVNHVE